MPVTLPQLSRRAFLKRAALAGAAAALAPHSYAGLFGKARDKHTFAFFSDSHIAADAKIDPRRRQHGRQSRRLRARTRRVAA